MKSLSWIAQLLRISHSQDIARRYLVVNGFDGTLAMLGLTMGFVVSEQVELSVVISACLGTAIALGMSGLSSAYLSEAAERKRELKELEQAMGRDLEQSSFGQASFWIPLYIAFVNGASPLLFALIVMLPLWWPGPAQQLQLNPLWLSVAIAFGIVFLLGSYLGKIGHIHWLWAGIRALIIAVLTTGLIWLFAQPV